MSYDVIRCLMMSYDVIRCNMMSYDLIRSNTMSYDAIQYHMMSDFVSSSPIGWKKGLNISLPGDNIHLPQKNWQRPFFKVVKLNFYAVASLSFPFQDFKSHSDLENQQQQMKVFFAFCSTRWDGCVSNEVLSAWIDHSICAKKTNICFLQISLQVEFHFKFTPCPAIALSEIKWRVAPSVSGSETTLNPEIKALTALRSSPTSYYCSNPGFHLERYYDHIDIPNFKG